MPIDERPASRRRTGYWALGLVGLAVVGLWLFHPWRGQPIRAVAPVREQPTPAAPAASTVADASTVVEDDLCGIAGMQRRRPPGASVLQHVADLTRPAMARWIDSLRQSVDDQRQALGIALAGVVGSAVGPYVTPASGGGEALVPLALRSADPLVYTLALGQCVDQGSGMAAACRQLSFQQLAQLDTDNAGPWLWMAAQARQRADAAQESLALAHAASAPRLSFYTSRLAALAIEAIPSDFSALERAAAGQAATHLARLTPSIRAVSAFCGAEAVRLLDRRDQCESIALLLVRDGDTYLEAGLAADIGRHVGWSGTRLTDLETQVQRAVELNQQGLDPWTTSTVPGAFGCQRLDAFNEFVATQAASGSEQQAYAAAWRRSHTAVGAASP